MTIAKAYLDGLEKDSSLLGLGLGAAAGHIGTNIALGQAMQGPRFLPDILRAGYQHGLEKKQVSPFREELVTKGLGPEIPALYHEARKAGKLSGMFDRMKAKGTDYQTRFADRLHSRAQGNPQLSSFLDRHQQVMSVLQDPQGLSGQLSRGASPEFREARVNLHKTLGDRPALLSAAHRAYLREKFNRPLTTAGRFLHGDPIVGSTQATVPGGYQGPLVGGKVTKAHRMMASAAKMIPEAAGLAATAVGIPGASEPTGHMLMNKTRDLLGRTRSGANAVKQWMSRAYSGGKGLLGMGPGFAGLPNKAISLLVSPGLSESQRMAGAVGRVARPLAEAAPVPQVASPPVAQPVHTARPRMAKAVQRLRLK